MMSVCQIMQRCAFVHARVAIGLMIQLYNHKMKFQ